MKLLVFGQTGQVARELAQTCPPGIEALFLDRSQADLSDPKTCAQAVQDNLADIVINAAAWTNVDGAEDAEDAATVINGAAPGAMARACAAKGLPFMHLSTDYVFDGTGTEAFAPDHPTAPLGAYGRSKRAGEIAVQDSGARHLILRTSWVVSAHGQNFIKTMRRLGAERETLRVVADQIGGLTPASAIAEALWTAARALHAGQPGGVYHFAGAPAASWADVARVVMEKAQLSCQIDDIPSSAYPTPAQRPLNSRLDCTSFARDFGITQPDWRAALDTILTDLGAPS